MSRRIKYFIVGAIFLITSNGFCMSEKASQAVELLKSSDTVKRRHGASLLTSLRSREAVPALIDALKDKDFGVKTSAADALGNLRDRRAVKSLIKVLNDENRNVRISAIVALGFIRDKQAVSPVIDLLKSDKVEAVRISAAQILGVLNDSNAVKPLIVALSDKKNRVKEQAARSLGRLKAEEAAGPLIKLIKNKKEAKSVKIFSIEALGEIKTAKSIYTLEGLLDEKDQELAVLSASSLGKQGNTKGLKTVLKYMDSEDVKVRRQAVIALAHIGVSNKKVRQAIKKAAKDSDQRVKKRASFSAKILGVDLEEGKE